MKPEVQDALWAWIAGAVIGALPLIAHLVAKVGFLPAAEANGGNWVVDILFMTLSISGMSLVSVLARPHSSEIVRGRAGPALTAMLVTSLVIAAMLYGAEAAGMGRDYALYVALGLLIGTAAVALFFDLTVAAKLTPEPR